MVPLDVARPPAGDDGGLAVSVRAWQRRTWEAQVRAQAFPKVNAKYLAERVITTGDEMCGVTRGNPAKRSGGSKGEP